MKRTVLVISTAVFGLALLAGCETLKGADTGAKKDIVNTGGHIRNSVNAVLEADQKFEEKYW